jgi:hypothetical protein
MTSVCHVELAKMLNTPKIAGTFLSKDNLLLTIASCGASGIGFLYDDYSLILGSMLISPIENTIVQSMLSVLLANNIGIINGSLSLLLMSVVCIGSGFIIGYINTYFNGYYKIPSENMKKITSSEFLITNLMIGIFCGFFMSYAIISNNVPAMHGLALIIFILPPLVNSGIYASLAEHNRKKDLKLHLEYRQSAINSFLIGFANMCGVGIAVLIGFWVFCPN